MNRQTICYLYYHSFTDKPGTILLHSIAHYSYFFSNYILVTNLDANSFPSSLKQRIKIVHPNSIESDHSSRLTKILQSHWSTGQLRANCPSIEIHCFRRWFLLRDLYQLGIIPADCLVFSHDWDDLLFRSLPEIINDSSELIHAHGSGLPVLISCTPAPVHQALQPHFILLNKPSIESYCMTIQVLSRKHAHYHPQLNFSDMVPWAYIYHKANTLSRHFFTALWGELFEKRLYFCDNIRSFLYIPRLVSRRIIIPSQFSCLPPGTDSLDVVAYFTSGSGDIFVASEIEGHLIPAVNAQYQGTEGKYIMMRDIQNLLRPFYSLHPSLLNF